MSNEPLLRTQATSNEPPTGTLATTAEGGKKGVAEFWRDQVLMILQFLGNEKSLNPASAITLSANPKNWPFLSAFGLAVVVFLLFLKHGVEGSTPITTMLAYFIATFGFVWTGVNMHLALVLQENVTKLNEENTKHQLENKRYKELNERLQVNLAGLEELERYLQESGKAAADLGSSTFQELTAEVASLRGNLRDQLRATMVNVFMDFMGMDGDRTTLSEEEYRQMSRESVPDVWKDAWNEFTFQTFPRSGGRDGSSPITRDELMSWVDSMLQQVTKDATSPTV